MPKPSCTRYRTTNWSAYNASLRKRGSLSVWFDPDMVWHAEKSGHRGRPETFSDAAIQNVVTFADNLVGRVSIVASKVVEKQPMFAVQCADDCGSLHLALAEHGPYPEP